MIGCGSIAPLAEYAAPVVSIDIGHKEKADCKAKLALRQSLEANVGNMAFAKLRKVAQELFLHRVKPWFQDKDQHSPSSSATTQHSEARNCISSISDKKLVQVESERMEIQDQLYKVITKILPNEFQDTWWGLKEFGEKLQMIASKTTANKNSRSRTSRRTSQRPATSSTRSTTRLVATPLAETSGPAWRH